MPVSSQKPKDTNSSDLFNRALNSFTFSGDSNASEPATLEVSMTQADISNKILGVSGAIMAAAFLPKMG